MTGAGQQYPVAGQQGYYPAQSPQQGYYPPGGQTQGPAFTMPQLLPVSTFGQPAFNMNFEDAKMGDVPKGYWYAQGGTAVLGAVGNMLSAYWNYELMDDAMEHQETIAVKYYETQDIIAGYQKDVAIEQLAVQGTAIEKQAEMHGNQVSHEQEMGRLEKETQLRLAQISEDGRTERAKILSVSNAFARSGWDMGAPMFG